MVETTAARGVGEGGAGGGRKRRMTRTRRKDRYEEEHEKDGEEKDGVGENAVYKINRNHQKGSPCPNISSRSGSVRPRQKVGQEHASVYLLAGDQPSTTGRTTERP